MNLFLTAFVSSLLMKVPSSILAMSNITTNSTMDPPLHDSMLNETWMNKTMKNDSFVNLTEREMLANHGMLFALFLFGFALFCYIFVSVVFVLVQALLCIIAKMCDACAECWPSMQTWFDQNRTQSASSSFHSFQPRPKHSFDDHDCR